MTVYVDTMRRRAQVGQGRPAVWSHLMADTHAELEAFARGLGLRPSWIQHAGTHREHYDVTETVRRQAVKAGAVEVVYPHGTGEVLARKRAAAAAVASFDVDAFVNSAGRCPHLADDAVGGLCGACGGAR